MIEIELQQIPNQKFAVDLDGHKYEIHLRSFQELTLATIYIDDVLVRHSVRCCPNQSIIPYNYLKNGGNLFFDCINKEYPYYKNFGITQRLYYISDAEVEELNAS